jgi:ribose transport system substrate-binding protein
MISRCLERVAVAACGLMLAAAPAMATDVKVALIPGGPHPYFANWEQGAKDAQKAFPGIAAADYKVPAKWELGLQNQLIENATAQGYNAFLIFPGDPVATNSPMADLQSAGIPSIATAGCTKDPTPALFCFGTAVDHSAYLGTKELIKALGGKGTIVHFTGNLVDPNTQLRMDAVAQAVKETNGAVKLLQTIADIDRTPQEADDKINALLAARGKDVDGIISTAWLPSVSAATALRRIGDKRIQMVGIDHDAVVLAAIKDGFVHGTMLQNPYGQAYIGTYVLSEIVAHGCKVNDKAPFKTNALTTRFIDSGTTFQGADGVDHYQDAMKAVTADLMKTFKATYLICP